MTTEGSGRQTAPPGERIETWLILGLAVVLVLGLFSIRCSLGPRTSRAYPSRALLPEPEPLLAAPEPVSEDYYPCSDCHEGITNRVARELEDDHEDLALAHGTLWCLHCHNAEQRDRLHLADETLVRFEESWRLCTQCHAKKLADWRAGLHGKRTGHWRGPKDYRTCVVCHDPHAPAFKPLEPKRRPRRPQEITLQAWLEGVNNAEQ